MKKGIAIFLIGLVLLPISACRRRIDPDTESTIYETVHQLQPAPMEGEGQKVLDPGLEPDPERIEKENDPKGNMVDETVAAQGGETRPEGPKAPERGQEVTVTLDAMGGECTRAAVRVNVGGVYGVLPTPTKKGQNFQGWFREQEGGEPVNEVTVVLTESGHTLYAHWSEKTEFLLTFDPNGGRISPYSSEKKIYAGGLYGELPEPMNSGYRFCGWFTEPEGGAQILATDVVTVLDDQTLYAQWEYSPMDYWTFVLKNASQRIYTCQEVSAYLELEARGTTMKSCTLLSDGGIQNIAAYAEENTVTDAWVAGKKPEVIVKLTDNMGAAEATKAAVERRFPEARVYVFPMEATEGSEEEQLYYKLRLAEICYPQLFEGMDMDAVAAELGVTGTVIS